MPVLITGIRGSVRDRCVEGRGSPPGTGTAALAGRSCGAGAAQRFAALRVIQRVRDEAHRFAIQGHRRKRARRHQDSILETVPGLGPAKRRDLLRHFGGLQGVLRAGVNDLSQVRGIGTVLARVIYDHLHPGA